MIESETTHLIACMPKLSGLRRAEIEQHYLSAPPEPLRIRSRDGNAFELTKKLRIDPADKSRSEEINIPLTAGEFSDLSSLTKRSVAKTRYYLPLEGGLTAEIDVFGGPLEGLSWVEVEFPDEVTREGFRAPEWFGRDITQEKCASNSAVAGKTYEDLLPQIEGRG